MNRCRSEPQLSLLGRIPPRTPGRSDAQVPQEGSLGEARYARFPHLYFYAEPGGADPVYGLLDIEISIQRRRDGVVWLEAYCVGDGYQSGHGSGQKHPLIVEIATGDLTLARIDWHYPSVLCGHFDPMTFETKTDLSLEDFERVDRIFLPSVAAIAESCSGAPATISNIAGH